MHLIRQYDDDVTILQVGYFRSTLEIVWHVTAFLKFSLHNGHLLKQVCHTFPASAVFHNFLFDLQ